jgi:hypothetical protein
MKRFWLVLLSLGLIVAFSTSAFAVDVKINGEYYVGGLYLNKVAVADNTGAANPNSAFFYQRLRVGTDFVVSDCLKLVTRFDAMERIWGKERTIRTTDATGIFGSPLPSLNTYNLDAGANTLESENIALEVAYLNYVSPIGLFQVGYMENKVWGTTWGNNGTGPTAGQIKYFVPVGPVTLVAAYAKEEEHNASAYFPISDVISGSPSSTRTDRDANSYRLGAIYNFKGNKVAGEAGALFIYQRDASQRGLGLGAYLTNAYTIMPYFKAKVGPVALQGELNYIWGELIDRETPTGMPLDVDIESLSFYLDAVADFGMFNVGGTLAYAQGDNDGLADGKFKSLAKGGRDFNPCLIMFNTDTVVDWTGALAGWNGTAVGGQMTNAWLYQLRAGVNPTKQLAALMSVSYAAADKKAGMANSTMGFEVDVTGTYKISNNLSYMLGVGYLFTGDYYKGAFAGQDAQDDFILINKLTLNF